MIRKRIKRDHVFRSGEITWQDRRIQPLCHLSHSLAILYPICPARTFAFFSRSAVWRLFKQNTLLAGPSVSRRFIIRRVKFRHAKSRARGAATCRGLAFSILFSYKNMIEELGRDREPMALKTQTLPNGFKATYRNDCEFEVICEDIFEREVYYFAASNAEPTILDCGGHIGLAVLYFKSLYPRAKIVTFEPNPETFALLKKNIAQNNLRGVQALNLALTRNGSTNAVLYVGRDFLKAWDSTDTIEPNLWVNMHEYRGIPVPSTRLSSYINGNVDFVKLDIEGAEVDVLDELDGKLAAVRAITLEYHQNPANLEERKLEKIIETLEAGGFKYQIFHQAERIARDELPQDPVYQLIVRATR